MASDGYQVVGNEVGFVAAVMLVYGSESLTRIEFEDRGDPQHPTKVFHLDVPSEDAKILKEDYDSGRLAVSDVGLLFRIYGDVTKTLRNMSKWGNTVWTSNSWIKGRG